MEKTLSRHQKESIPSLVLYGLKIKGKTIDELGTGHVGDSSQSAWHSMSVWHKKSELDEWVARELHLSEDLWGPNRKSNDLMVFTSREIFKLRKKSILVDWSTKKRTNLFRLSDPEMNIPKPVMSMTRGQTELVPTTHTEEEMKAMFMSIISKSRKDNTYKFALGKTLLDYCKNNPWDKSTSKIKYDYLAGEFLRHYWYQKYKFRLKQDFHTEKKPVVIKILENVFREKQPVKFKDVKSEDLTRARKMILGNVFGKARQKKGMVVPRFQRIMDGTTTRDNTVFYDYNDDKQEILLRPEAHAFFRNNHALLTRALLAEWILYLEKANHGLPMLAAKIDDEEAERGALTKYRTVFDEMGEKHCFYCNGRLERNYTEVDHFIPWSYIFEDSAWNLVLACKDCNRDKSNSLPPNERIGDLIDRDEKYSRTMQIMRLSLFRLSVGGAGTWKKEIHNHYKICSEYGFGNWNI